MAWQTFSNLAGGNEPSSLFDTLAAQIARNCVVICTAAGSNAIALTPDTTNGPPVPSYLTQQLFSWIQAGDSSGLVTINVSSLGAKKLFRQDGVTQIGSGDLKNLTLYVAIYNAALDAAAGGFILTLTNPLVGQIPGTVTNDNAGAGNIGEFVTATVVPGSAVALTTLVSANVTQISLTAGDWDVSGIVQFNGNATTTVSQLVGSISTVSAGIQSANGARADTNYAPAATVLQAAGSTFPGANPLTQRFSLNATTTIFLVALAVFGTSTAAAFGTIRARRVR
jgi:hypothetical protein